MATSGKHNRAPRTNPSRGGAGESRVCSKGWFRLFKINPGMGIKDFGPTCRKSEFNGKPINGIPAFCPRATAEGMAELVSVVQTGYLSWKQGTGFMEVWCELSKNKCCTDLSGISQTERKGWPIRSKSARRAGLRTLGLTQKVGMANVPAKVCMASGKKINLLFCDMNTYQDRKSR